MAKSAYEVLVETVAEIFNIESAPQRKNKIFPAPVGSSEI